MTRTLLTRQGEKLWTDGLSRRAHLQAGVVAQPADGVHVAAQQPLQRAGVQIQHLRSTSRVLFYVQGMGCQAQALRYKAMLPGTGSLSWLGASRRCAPDQQGTHLDNTAGAVEQQPGGDIHRQLPRLRSGAAAAERLFLAHNWDWLSPTQNTLLSAGTCRTHDESSRPCERGCKCPSSSREGSCA